MVTLDVKALIKPVGIVRILELAFTCISFSLVASLGPIISQYWRWCMWTWCFCFAVTLLILFVEFFQLNAKLPVSWCDFTSHFSMLATLKLLAASVIYPRFFVHSSGSKQIAASVTSCVAFILYAAEVKLTRAKPGEVSGFMSTVPGLLKTLEAFVACVIFMALEPNQYSRFPELKWCVAVYSMCFIFALVTIIFAIGRLLRRCPVPFEKVLTCCNALAVIMYLTATAIWPLYSFGDNPRPDHCPKLCPWDNMVVITAMTCVNLIAYIVDTFYSVRLVSVTPEQVSDGA